jgi:glucuronokinase
MKALMGFYGVEILDHVLPNVVLSAETEELGLTAGLQDRVAQAYEGLVYMDFGQKFMRQNGYGRYERLDYRSLPRLYVAYRRDLSEESSRAHIRVRELYEMGNDQVVKTMERIAALTDEARESLNGGNSEELTDIIDRNFDLRAEIYPISGQNLEMVEAARSTGASCKFCGSGGAVVGTYENDRMRNELQGVMKDISCELVIPEIVGPQPTGR